jgi:hypothetical protein
VDVFFSASLMLCFEFDIADAVERFTAEERAGQKEPSCLTVHRVGWDSVGA